MSDAVNHPNHYTKDNQIECIAAIKASMSLEEFLGAMKSQVEKYVWRYRDKNGLQDLQKAKVYLDWLIEAYVEFCKHKGITFNGERPV